MKESKLGALAFGAVLAGVQASFAAQTISGQQVIYVATGWVAEGIYVHTAVNNTSVDGCGPKYRIEANHPMLKEMMAILLSAYHTGAKVDLFVRGCVAPDTMKLESVAATK